MMKWDSLKDRFSFFLGRDILVHICVSRWEEWLVIQLLFNVVGFFLLVSPCDSLSCQNDGSCRVEAGIAACFCKGDYSGSLCEGKH